MIVFKNIMGLFKASDQLGLSFIVLQLVHQAISKIGTGQPLEFLLKKEIQKIVYSLLPQKWKVPSGKLSELEFFDIIEDGMVFYQSVSRAFKL